jgi:hypothetical protein
MQPLLTTEIVQSSQEELLRRADARRRARLLAPRRHAPRASVRRSTRRPAIAR